MLNVTKLMPQGRGLASALLKRAATLDLDWATRQQHHFDATDSQGRALHVHLPEGQALHGGDVLVAEDGSLVVVKAAVQAVLEVRACAEHGSPKDLLLAAHYLGSEHVPLDAQDDHLKVAPDSALAEALRRRHLIVAEAQAAFDPAGEAHDHGHHHHHGHDHHGHGSHHH